VLRYDASFLKRGGLNSQNSSRSTCLVLLGRAIACHACGPFRWLVELEDCLGKPVVISSAFTEVVTDMAAKA
jgi:hypothetical protein